MSTQCHRPWISLLPLLFLLSACAGFGGISKGPANLALWQQRGEALRQLDHWRLSGRMSISGEKSPHAQGRVNWSQQQDRYKLNLSGPFGIGAMRLKGGPRGVEVRSKEGVVRAANAATALRNELGWDVPVESLRYWMVGRPAPVGAAELHVNDLGQLRILQQHGWEVEYLAYRRAVDYQLPKKMVARREGVEVRFVIDDWEPNYRPKKIATFPSDR